MRLHKNMNEELNKLLNELPEEEQSKFIENAKKQLQASLKSAADRKAKEEQKKLFKASGHWETESEEKDSKITLDITEDNKKEIIFDFNNGDISFALTKKEFFNFYNLLKDAYESLKEENNTEDPWTKYIENIAKNIARSSRLIEPIRPRYRSKIFHIN